jgi:DNA-binding transcriptional LysR family regulator
MSLLSPQIEAFMAVVDKQTVHEAAKVLFLTQTAVTQRIKGLEKKLGATLFIRSRKGMRLTPEGEALFQYARAAKSLEGEAISNIKTPGVKAEVKAIISAPSSLMHTRIVPKAIGVMKAFPNLLLEFDIENADIRQHKLKGGQVDFAIVQPEHVEAQMSSKRIKPEKYILVAPAAWQTRKIKDILENERIIDFCESDELTLRYLEYFKLSKYKRPQRYFINDIKLLAKLIVNEVGYSVLTEELAASYLDDKSLCLLNHGKIYEHQQMLIWYRREYAPGYFTALLNIIE